MSQHVHKAISGKTQILGWTGCVKRRPCDGKAHGGVVYLDRCRCGAVRRIESNGNRKVNGGWRAA
jgi:hypothetical protein